MVTMKAGTYYIGDCCYVLDEKYLKDFDWVNDFCEQFFDDGGEITIKGKRICAFATMYGDGEYESNVGFEFPVDAGLIGCTPKVLWKGEGEPFGSLKVVFKEDFNCYSENGLLVFGHVKIDTECEQEDWE